jgi:hypothetical protein
MLFFRNVQVFYRAIDNEKSRATIAIENPGASGDGGRLLGPRRSAEHLAAIPAAGLDRQLSDHEGWGHVQGSGILRKISYDDNLNDGFELGGSVTGWGLSISSAVKATDNDTLRLQYVYGEGIQNYFNDAPVDVGVKNNLSNPLTPLLGEALPIQGLVLFVDHNWNSKYSTSVGYSRVDIDNSDGQAAERLQGRSVLHRQPAVHAGAQRDDRRRAPVGPSRELLGRFLGGRPSGCSSRSSTASRTKWEGNHV